MVPRCANRNEIAGKTRCLCDRRHVSDEISAQTRVLVGFEIGETDNRSRPNGRRDEMCKEPENELLLPQEIKRNDRGSNIGGEFRGVNLVKQELFL